jgi:hypothetical protein
MGHVTGSYWFLVRNLIKTGCVTGGHYFLVRNLVKMENVMGPKLKILFSRLKMCYDGPVTGI